MAGHPYFYNPKQSKMKSSRFILTIVIGIICISTTKAQIKEDLEAVNTQVWSKFYSAFETLNAEHMADIHADDLVRVSGGSNIQDYDTYINNYRNNYKRLKAQGGKRNIALRFFERLNNGNVASERGIYQLTVNKGMQDEQSYYGQFHVILKKRDGRWKITLDYDSNENNTVGESQFLAAHALDNLEVFIGK